MNERPRIKIVPDRTDKVLLRLSIILLLAITAFSVWLYIVSPQIIPAHFDLTGKPDSYGDKGSIFILTGIALFVFFLLNTIIRYPHVFNYPQNITEENAPALYRSAIKMLRFLNAGILLLILLLETQMHKGIRDHFLPMQWCTLPLLIIFTIGIPLFVSLKMFSHKQK